MSKRPVFEVRFNNEFHDGWGAYILGQSRTPIYDDPCCQDGADEGFQMASETNSLHIVRSCLLAMERAWQVSITVRTEEEK
jgi:hypothetical protein